MNLCHGAWNCIFTSCYWCHSDEFGAVVVEDSILNNGIVLAFGFLRHLQFCHAVEQSQCAVAVVLYCLRQLQRAQVACLVECLVRQFVVGCGIGDAVLYEIRVATSHDARL